MSDMQDDLLIEEILADGDDDVEMSLEEEAAHERKLEMLGARKSGLNPLAMTELEKKYMPEFIPFEEEYLDIRNGIAWQWHCNSGEQQLRDKIVDMYHDDMVHMTGRIFDFLEAYGFINVGFYKQEAEPSPYHSNVRALERREKKRIVVIGAGAAGLAAAMQLQAFGHNVTVVEGRDRIGGRVNTDTSSFSGPVDLGASIITGMIGSPVNVLVDQLCSRQNIAQDRLLHPINGELCPLLNKEGKNINQELDDQIQSMYNDLLQGTDEIRARAGLGPPDNIKKYEELDKHPSSSDRPKLVAPDSVDPEKLSIAEGLTMVKEQLKLDLSPEQQTVLNWHISNLEYGCASPLDQVSLVHWDQDDEYAFLGQHYLLKKGWVSVLGEMANVVRDVRLNHIVKSVAVSDDEKGQSVTVTCVDGNHDDEEVIIDADHVLVTASLGVLKAKSIEFDPPLPSWKTDSIERLGFGLLNKLVLEFPERFWDGKLDFWGQLRGDDSVSEIDRGRFYQFWNLERCMDKPVLVALITGRSAHKFEEEDDKELTAACLKLLRQSFGDDVPDPINSVCTRWKADELARGSYSFVAVGSTAADYDNIGKPVHNNAIFFAGEATNKHNPATVPGAMVSGLRKAGDIVRHCATGANQWHRVSIPPSVIKLRDDRARHLEETKGGDQGKRSGRDVGQAISLLESVDPSLDFEAYAAQVKMNYKRRRGIRDVSYNPNAAQIVDLVSESMNVSSASTSIERKRQLAEARERALKRKQLSATFNSLLYSDQSSNHEYKSQQLTSSFGVLKLPETVIGGEARDMKVREEDDGGLPTVSSFIDSDDEYGDVPASAADILKLASSPLKKRKRSKQSHKHAKRSKRDGGSSRRGGSSKKSAYSLSSHDQAEMIRQSVKKRLAQVISEQDDGFQLPKDVHKIVLKKACNKVVTDWRSKDRKKVTVPQWLSHKRKAKIAVLIQKYIDRYVAESKANK